MEGFPATQDVDVSEREAEVTELQDQIDLLLRLRDSIRNNDIFFFQQDQCK